MQGCYIHGLYIEGARFDTQAGQLKRSHPKVLVEELAILAVVPIEAHRLKLQVCIYAGSNTVCKRQVLMSSCIYIYTLGRAHCWGRVVIMLVPADICLNAVH